MPDQIKTRPLADNKALDDLFPHRFLKPEDLIKWKVTQLTVAIDYLQEEEVIPRIGAPAEYKPVLYFRAKSGSVHPQGYLLSAKMDKDSLKSSTGAATIGELASKKIVIKIDTWKGAAVLRIDPNPVKE